MFILLFIVLLIVLIIVHELGHFSFAKLFGIKVDEFGVFFPPRLFAKKFGETEYSFNLLPLGGFVKIFGENYDEGAKDQRSFVMKPRYVQALVLLAGIFFNLLFAWLVLSVGYMVGMPTPVDHIGFGQVTTTEVLVSNVIPNSPADKAGVIPGDILEKIQTATDTLAINTLNTNRQAEAATNFITSHETGSIGVTVQRNSEEKLFLMYPADNIVTGRKAIGIGLDDVGTLKLNPVLALGEGALVGWNIVTSTAGGLAGFFSQLFTAKANFSQVSGPIGITVYGAAALKQGFAAGVTLIALISVNLALINLIPIPGLDGGRLLIVLIEAILRRPVSPSLVMKFTLAGLALLITLMIVVSYHDITKLLG